MDEAFKTVYEKFPATERPGKPFMARRLSQVEDNDPCAEPLTDVASVEDGEDDLVIAEPDASGAVRTTVRKHK
eukprot:40405-Lingulodinium_polyedra.AAC.1